MTPGSLRDLRNKAPDIVRRQVSGRFFVECVDDGVEAVVVEELVALADGAAGGDDELGEDGFFVGGHFDCLGDGSAQPRQLVCLAEILQAMDHCGSVLSGLGEPVVEFVEVVGVGEIVERATDFDVRGYEGVVFGASWSRGIWKEQVAHARR